MKTVSIPLSDEIERQLRTRASQHGESLESYLSQLAQREAQSPTPFSDPLAEGVAWLASRTPEDVDAARARLLTQPVRPLPPGQSLVETVERTWPGTESESQIEQALERLS